MNDDKTVRYRYQKYADLADAAQGKHVTAPHARQIKELTLQFSNMPGIATSYYRSLEISGQFKSF